MWSADLLLSSCASAAALSQCYIEHVSDAYLACQQTSLVIQEQLTKTTWPSSPVVWAYLGSSARLHAGLGSASNAPGDLAAGLLWSVSLYFCSPLQLLLLFLGRIETERPSDWVLRQLGHLTAQP